MADRAAMHRGVRRPAAAGAGSHGTEGVRRSRRVRPGEPVLPHRLQRVVVLHAAVPAGRRRRRAAPVRAGDGRRGRGLHLQPRRRPHPRLSGGAGAPARTCTRSTGSPPRSATLVPADELESASSATRTSSRRAPISPWSAACRRTGWSTRRSWSTGFGWSSRRTSCAQLRIAGTHRRTRDAHGARQPCGPAARQCDVVAEIMAAQATGTPEHGGDYPAIVPMLPTGEAAGTPHLTWTDRPFETGEATTIELAGVIRPLPRAAGAHGDAGRTTAASSPTPRR